MALHNANSISICLIRQRLYNCKNGCYSIVVALLGFRDTVESEKQHVLWVWRMLFFFLLIVNLSV